MAVKSVELVTIAKEDYDYLVSRNKMLESLEAAGVDNWEGYALGYDEDAIDDVVFSEEEGDDE